MATKSSFKKESKKKNRLSNNEKRNLKKHKEKNHLTYIVLLKWKDPTSFSKQDLMVLSDSSMICRFFSCGFLYACNKDVVQIVSTAEIGNKDYRVGDYFLIPTSLIEEMLIISCYSSVISSFSYKTLKPLLIKNGKIQNKDFLNYKKHLED